ncbi:hypothetical protein GQ44DRAFT_735097 [Phaeosphaeriaceae sp. PMI808]|nr:hypothetical protein GQ44DRAFT_735097 [Phaeosphaeriaceae sp. PMI808]
MPGFLSRSKSMRLLKGHRKDTQQEQVQISMPHVGTSQTNDRYLAAAPIWKAEGGLETPDIGIRPNTSGGPGDRRTLFHMKTNPVPSIHSQNDLALSLPVKSTTLLYTAEVTDSSEGIIGIALGSPTAGSHWTSTPQAATFDTNIAGVTDSMSAFSQPSRSPSPVVVQQQQPKSKLGRWKSIFRKAPPTPPQEEKPSFYQLTQTVATTRTVRADSHHDEESIEPPAEAVKGRDVGRTPSPPAFKPNIRASRAFTTPQLPPEALQSTTPTQSTESAQTKPIRPRAFTANSLPANPRASIQRAATTSSPPKKTTNSPSAALPLVVSKRSREVQNLPADKPFLDVSIPDITLDRYSVMFGNLLQNSNPTPNSSLLVRRQVNAEKLTPLGALSVKQDEQESPVDYRLQRRATSPTAPSPSPRLSLFPNTSNSRPASPRSASVPRFKAVHKSKATPEKSPLRHTFSRSREENNKGQELFIQRPISSSNLKPKASMNLKVQELALTPNSTHSFESDTDSVTLEVTRSTPGYNQKVRLDEREPEWEMLSKPVAIGRSNTLPAKSLTRTGSQRQPKPTKLSALSSHPSSAPLEAPFPLQRIQQLQSPPLSANEMRKQDGESTARAMVGVARSISVSRANSPRALVGTPSDLRSPHDRLMERQGLTPTMVEVKNRRSQRVQLVDS